MLPVKWRDYRCGVKHPLLSLDVASEMVTTCDTQVFLLYEYFPLPLCKVVVFLSFVFVHVFF